MKPTVLAFVVASLIASGLGPATAGTEPPLPPGAAAGAGLGAARARLFPAVYGEMSHRFFFNRRSAFYEDRYVSELDLRMDFVAAAFANGTTLDWDMQLRTGMGESLSSHLPFAVNELHYRLGPFVEQRRAGGMWRTGLDHSCSHLVFKDVETPWYADTSEVVLRDVYYNRLYAGIGSEPARLADERRQRRSGRAVPPLAWYVEGGYYLRSFFGIIDPDTLYEANEWAWDARSELRCTLWTSRAVALLARNEASVLGGLDGETWWRDRIGLEAMLLRGGFGMSFFLNWSPVDNHPRDARENLGEAGLRVFF